MASANLDLVRSIYADWERGDFRSTEWADPEIEFVFAGGPSPGSWSGVSPMAVAMRDFLQAWNSYSVQADDYRELDDERILVRSHFGGHGRTSGVELGQIGREGTELFQLRAGKVVRLVIYWNRAQALADLGLDTKAEAKS
jgi:ketosteroid isomerase-like protein